VNSKRKRAREIRKWVCIKGNANSERFSSSLMNSLEVKSNIFEGSFEPPIKHSCDNLAIYYTLVYNSARE
jgi:hypothetical protein